MQGLREANNKGMDLLPEQFHSIKEKIDQVFDLAKEINGLNRSVMKKLQNFEDEGENFHQIRSIIKAAKILLEAIEKINTGQHLLGEALYNMHMQDEYIGIKNPDGNTTVDNSSFSIKLPSVPLNTFQQSPPTEWLPQLTPKSTCTTLPPKRSNVLSSFDTEGDMSHGPPFPSQSTIIHPEMNNPQLQDLITQDPPQSSDQSLQVNSVDSDDTPFISWFSRYLTEKDMLSAQRYIGIWLQEFQELLLRLTQHTDDISDLVCLSSDGHIKSFALYTKEIDREVLTFQQSATRPVRGTGPDTVLCLDTSASMRGAGLQRIKSAVHRLIDGIETMANYEEIQENIAVVTFGSETKVALHLTNDYQQVRCVVESVTAEGQTPIFQGLMTCVSAILGNESVVKLNEVHLVARIIIVTDGKFSAEDQKEEIEKADDETRLMGNVLLPLIGKLFKINGHVCYHVSIGNEKSKYLESTVVGLTNGKTVPHDSIDELAFMSKYLFAATRLLWQCPDLVYGDRKETADEKAALNALLELECEANHGSFDFTESEKTMIVDLALDISWRPSTTMNEPLEYSMQELDQELPDIGTRVKRGPDWRYGGQDGHGPGTVVGQNRNGTVDVIWDSGVMPCTYHFKEQRDIQIVEYGDERIPRHNEAINIGCKVKRGPGWISGDEDGGPGSIGVVCRCTRKGAVAVRWPNKTIQYYEFGEEVCFAVSSGGLHAVNNDSNLQNIKSTLPIKKVPSSYDRSGGNDSNLHFFKSDNLISGSFTDDRRLSREPDLFQLPMIECRDPEWDREIPVIWSYNDNTSDKWREFDVKNMRKLEADFQKKKKTTVLQMDTKDFRVVFATMKMLETKVDQQGNRTEFYVKREPKEPNEDQNRDDVFT